MNRKRISLYPITPMDILDLLSIFSLLGIGIFFVARNWHHCPAFKYYHSKNFGGIDKYISFFPIFADCIIT